MSTPNLQERRMRVLAQLDELFAKGPNGEIDYDATVWSDEKQVKYDALMKEEAALRTEEDRVDSHMDAHQRAERNAQRQVNRDPRSVDELAQRDLERQENFRSWALTGRGSDPDIQAAQTTTDAAGGYTIPEEVAPEVESIMALGGPMLSIVRLTPRSDGSTFNVPTADYSSVQAQRAAEGAAASDATDLTFGNVAINFDYMTTDILVASRELLQDSAVDIDAELTNVLASWMGALLNTVMTTGTGGTNMDGFTEHASYVKAVTKAKGDAIKYENLIDLRGSIYRPHRDNAQFGMDQTVETAIMKIKSHDDTPVIGASIRDQDGAGLRLASRPYHVNDDLPVSSATASAVQLVYGNFQSYRAFTAGGIEVLRFEDSPYASKRLVGFMMQQRWGGKLVTAAGATGNRQPIKHLANGT